MKEKKLKKDVSINNRNSISLHHILWYFIIFSMAGLLIETVYCYATTGVLESRKGLLWGPFCPVYGVGATALIVVLNRFRDNKLKLIIFGGIAGDIAEYIMSYVLEAVYSTRFWDYSYTSLHLNGRICLIYTIFWSILALVLICFVKPLVDNALSKIESIVTNNNVKIMDTIVTVIIFIDIVCTVWGINVYKDRAINLYYNKGQNNSYNIVENVQNTLFSNEKMLKTFPNIRFRNDKNEEIWIKDVI